VEKVDMIICGKYIVTLDSADRTIPRGAVAVRDGVVVDVDVEENIRSRYKAEEVLERRDHIIVPGLVDCHTHTQQYLLRSAIDDEMLQLPPVWTKLLVPFERIMGEELARLSSRASIANMLRNGVTSFIEAGAPYPEVLAEEVLASGIRGFVTYATYDIAEEKVAEPRDVLDRVERLYRDYSNRGDNLRVWASIRQVMMVSEELLEGVIGLTKKLGLGLTLHLGEYQGEVDYVLSRYGMRPLEYMVRRGLGDVDSVVIAHGVYLSPGEVRILRDRGFCLCWCPTVDSWLMGVHWAGFEDVGGVRLGIGSDGGAWGRIDLLHEAKIAKALSKAVGTSIRYYKAGMDSRTILRVLSGSAGTALGERVGRLERGYRADVVVLDVRSVRNLPVIDPVDAVVNYLEGDCVTDVVVGGRLLVEGGELKTIDEGELLEKLLDKEDEVREKIAELRRNIGARPPI